MYHIIVKLDNGDEIMAYKFDSEDNAIEYLIDVERVLGDMESHSIRIGKVVTLKGRIAYVIIEQQIEQYDTLS